MNSENEKKEKKSTQFYNIPSEEQGLHKSPFILYDPRENWRNFLTEWSEPKRT